MHRHGHDQKAAAKVYFSRDSRVVIIVAGALGLINTISYMRMEAQVETILSYISQNGGKVPLYTSPKETSWFGETDWSQNTPDFPISFGISAS